MASPLANYTQEKLPVPLKAGEFFVRGLGMDDISLLVRAHFDSLEALFTLYRRSISEGPADGDPTARLLLSFVQDAPALCAQVIAIAADEPDQADKVRQMPFPVLVDAIGKVGRLTFEDVGGPENFAQALAGLLAGMKRPSPTPG